MPDFNSVPGLRLHPPSIAQPVPFIPGLVGMIRSSSRDRDLAALIGSLQQKPAEIAARYDAVSPRTRGARYGIGFQQAETFQGTFKELLERSLRDAAKAILNRRLQLKLEVRKELHLLSALSPAQVLALAPGTYSQRVAVRRYWRNYFGEGCCGTSSVPPVTPVSSKYGMRLSELFCEQTEDSGQDEVYLLSVAVDGAGSVIPIQSPVWDMNEEDASIERIRPHWYVYPPADPRGFLDISAQLREEDGNYVEVGKALMGIGGAVSAIGTLNPYVAIAGAVIIVAGQIVDIIQSGDEDDDLGSVNLEFPTAPALQSGVGAHGASYTGDDASYQAKFELLVA